MQCITLDRQTLCLKNNTEKSDKNSSEDVGREKKIEGTQNTFGFSQVFPFDQTRGKPAQKQFLTQLSFEFPLELTVSYEE